MAKELNKISGKLKRLIRDASNYPNLDSRLCLC